MSMNVANCPKCGRVYVKNINGICPACNKEIDLMCEKCIKHLRANRGITLQKLSDETEVTVSQITKFIREGKISLMGSPNMAYPCEVCGTEIRERSMCDSCRSKMAKNVSNSKEDEQRIEAQRIADNKVAFKISDRLKER